MATKTTSTNKCYKLLSALKPKKRKLWKLLYGSTQFEHDVQLRGGIINGFDK